MCENVIIEGHLDSRKIKINAGVIVAGQSYKCDEINMSGRKGIKISNPNRFKMKKSVIPEIIRTVDADGERNLHLDVYSNSYFQNLETYQYNIDTHFSAEMTSRSSMESSNPSFYVLFTQDESQSWVDITMEVSFRNASDQTKARDDDIYITDIVNLEGKSSYKPTSFGETLILRTHPTGTNKNKAKVKVRAVTLLQATSPLVYDRELRFSRDVTLAKNTNFMVKLPGTPKFVAVTNSGKKRIVLEVIWMKGTHNKYKARLKKHTGHCRVKVKVEVECRNLSYKTKGTYQGLHFEFSDITISIKDICRKCKTNNFTAADKSNGLIGCHSKAATGFVEERHLHQVSRFF